MRFSPGRFNRHLENMGQQYDWRRSWGCACKNAQSGAPDPKCKICFGKGTYWEPSVRAGAATANQKTQQSWAMTGRYETGDIVMTVPENSPLYDAGQFDRIIMRNANERFTQTLTRAAPTERLLFSVQSVERVFWKSTQTQLIVEGGIPKVDGQGILTWTEGAPPPGTTYSITGQKLAEYFIYMDLPRSRNMHNGARLPKNIVFRRFDLFGR